MKDHERAQQLTEAHAARERRSPVTDRTNQAKIEFKDGSGSGWSASIEGQERREP